MIGKRIWNFGKNVVSTPACYEEPKSEDEVLRLLAEHNDQTVRVVSSGHAWSDGIKTDGLLLSLKNLNEVRVHEERGTVWVGAGCKVRHLLHRLDTVGLTLPSVGLIDEQTVAGATATGTHGSGRHSLSHYICGVRIASFDSESNQPLVKTIDSGPEMEAARCSLGLLGVVLEVELETRPVYRVEEHMQSHKSLESVLAAESQYPLQQFFLMPWSWILLGQHRIETTKPRSRSAGLYRVYWHLGIDWGLHLLMYLLVKIIRIPAFLKSFYRLVLPLVMFRNWKVVDDSHAMLTMEHELFRHIEIELFVTRSTLSDALAHVRRSIESFAGKQDSEANVPKELVGTYCHHYPICMRRIMPDATMISMATPMQPDSDEDWYAISLISFEWPSKRDGFFGFAKYMADSMSTQFNARCHWGKYNPLDRETNESLYPRIKEFRSVVADFDSQGRFANDWLKRSLLSPDTNAE